MSFIDDSPYIKTLKYWSRKLSKKQHKVPFLVTKCLEFIAYTYGKYFVSFHPRDSEKSTIRKKQTFTNNRSKIAVIIPFYAANFSDTQKLQRLFDSLGNQTIRPSLIVAVNDYSLAQIQIPTNITEIRLNKKSGAAKARNAGLERAIQEGCGVIAFTDSDCVADEGWIEAIRDSFSANDTHALSGMTRSFGKTWFDTYHDINGTLNGRKFSDNTLLYGPTCNFAISAELAASIRFCESFPAASGEDIEFCIQAISRGFKIYHSNKMIVYHDYSYKKSDFLKNIFLLFRQFSRYAGSQRILVDKAPQYFDLFSQTAEITEIN